ncbi:36399_t:CDS:1, partial [Racocetra persica]
DYLNLQTNEEELGFLIEESKKQLEKVKEEIETIKNNIENEESSKDDFEIIDKDLTTRERYKDELKKLIHE